MAGGIVPPAFPVRSTSRTISLSHSSFRRARWVAGRQVCMCISVHMCLSLSLSLSVHCVCLPQNVSFHPLPPPPRFFSSCCYYCKPMYLPYVLKGVSDFTAMPMRFECSTIFSPIWPTPTQRHGHKSFHPFAKDNLKGLLRYLHLRKISTTKMKIK